MPPDGSDRPAKGSSHVQLPPFRLTLAASEGMGKANPREELAITRLSKRPCWRNGAVSTLGPYLPPMVPPHYPLPSHPPETCQRILFYTSCLSMSSLSDVHSPSGCRKVSSKGLTVCLELHFHDSGTLQTEQWLKLNSNKPSEHHVKGTSIQKWSGWGSSVCRVWGRQGADEDQQLDQEKAKKIRRAKWETRVWTLSRQ